MERGGDGAAGKEARHLRGGGRGPSPRPASLAERLCAGSSVIYGPSA